MVLFIYFIHRDYLGYLFHLFPLSFSRASQHIQSLLDSISQFPRVNPPYRIPLLRKSTSRNSSARSDRVTRYSARPSAGVRGCKVLKSRRWNTKTEWTKMACQQELPQALLYQCGRLIRIAWRSLWRTRILVSEGSSTLVVLGFPSRCHRCRQNACRVEVNEIFGPMSSATEKMRRRTSIIGGWPWVSQRRMWGALWERRLTGKVRLT